MIHDDGYFREAQELFCALPAENTREYEKKIANYAERCTDSEHIEMLKQFIASDSQWAFEAFYVLCTIYRRNKDFELMCGLIEKYRARFAERISFDHIVVQYQVHSESFYDYDELLSLAYSSAQLLPDNAGYLQAFCNAFATICEQCNREDRDRIVSEWYDKALTSINNALELDSGYAKFYCTKARILALKGRFAEANNLVNQAISKEKSSRPDYAIAIMKYQFCRTEFAIEKQRREYDAAIASMQEEIDKLRARVEDNAADENGTDTAKPAAVSIYEGNEPYVFVSYSHMDKDDVYSVIQMLDNNGARVWYDDGIHGGDEWPEVIGERLLKSYAVMVMLSENSVQSANVRREVTLALGEQIKTVVIKMDDTALTPGMKLQLSATHMIEANRVSRQELQIRLTKALGKEIGFSCQ